MGGGEDKKKIHLVKWETIIRDQEVRGLGLKILLDMSVAFLTKLGWRLITDKSNLWARVMAAKYIKGNPKFPN